MPSGLHSESKTCKSFAVSADQRPGSALLSRLVPQLISLFPLSPQYKLEKGRLFIASHKEKKKKAKQTPNPKTLKSVMSKVSYSFQDQKQESEADKNQTRSSRSMLRFVHFWKTLFSFRDTLLLFSAAKQNKSGTVTLLDMQDNSQKEPLWRGWTRRLLWTKRLFLGQRTNFKLLTASYLSKKTVWFHELREGKI